MSTDHLVPARIRLAATPSPRLSAAAAAAAAQLGYLFPPAPFPVHVGYGPPPAGYREVDAWRVIPGRSSPRFLVPVPPAAAARIVVSHNGLRRGRVAAARRAASLVVRPLAAVQGDRGVLRVCVPHEVDDAAVEAGVVTRHLRRRVPGAAGTAISLRAFHPRAKPTVQVVDADGRVLAFAKVAADPATGARVLREADLLTLLGEPLTGPHAPVRLPRVLDRGTCGPFTVSVVEPLPADVVAVTAADEAAVLARYAVLAGPPTTMPLSGTDLWRDVLERVERARPAAADRPDLVAGLEALTAVLLQRDADLVVPTGRYHGDWVPWNMAWQGAAGDPARTLWVWDLEYGSPCGPLGLDGLRWVFQGRHVVDRATLTAAVAAMHDAAPRVLAAAGYPAAQVPAAGTALVRLHVVETLATALGLLAAGRGLPDGLDPDAVDVMAQLTR